MYCVDNIMNLLCHSFLVDDLLKLFAHNNNIILKIVNHRYSTS